MRLLQEKDRQLAAKDTQIEMLLKRPRTTISTTNRFIVNQSVNVFGKESISHISDSMIQELLKDPETSVAKVVALQRSVAENVNIVIPNVRERRWLVMEECEGEKQWKSKEKNHVLDQLWENGAFVLDAEVDESTAVGKRWTRWAERVRSCQNERGRLYREQLNMMEHSLLDQRGRDLGGC